VGVPALHSRLGAERKDKAVNRAIGRIPVVLTYRSITLALLALATVGALSYGFQMGGMPASAKWFFLVPVSLVTLAAAAALPPTAPSLLVRLSRRLSRVNAIWPVSLAALATSFTVAQVANNGTRLDTYWPTFGLWGAAVVTVAAVALAPSTRWLTRDRALLKPLLAANRADAAIMLGLFVAALVPRMVNLSGEPAPFSGDEAAMGLQAVNVMKGELNNMFQSGLQGHPHAYFFSLAGFFEVFGVNVMAQRLSSALAGAFAIPALYLLLRSWFGRWVGFLSAAYLVTYHLHVHFSRVAMNNVGDTLFIIVSLYLAWRAVRTLAPEDFALTGLATGISLYFYVGARITPLVVIGFLAFAAFIRPRTIPAMLRGGVIAAISYGVVTLPLGVFWLTHQDEFMNRINTVGVFQSGWFDQQLDQGRSSVGIMWDQVKHSLGAFGYYKDTSPQYAAPISFVDRFSLIPFLAGFAVSVFRVRDLRYLALLLTFALTVLTGSILTVLPPTSSRMLGTVPVIAAWVGIGLASLSGWLTFGRVRAALVLAAVGLAVLLAYNVHFYFFRYRAGEYYSDSNTRTVTMAADYVKGFPPETQVYWFGAPYVFTGHPAFEFPLRDRLLFDVLDDGRIEPMPPKDAFGPLFIFLPHRYQELGLVRDACPGGEVRVFRNKEGVEGFTSYETPPSLSCPSASWVGGAGRPSPP